MIPLTMLLLTALPAQQPRFDTDTTVAVPEGSRLRLHNQSGDILIRTWNRQEIRVQAMHAARARVEVDIRGQVVDLRARDRMGMPRAVDYELTVPVSMALDVGGMHSEISIDGIRAPVKANTLDGNITLRGGTESIQLTALSGRIDVAGARGRREVRAVSNSVTVNDVEGDRVV
ncbi:MAG: head GIN domain-containing protein, partial [Gemmatimonadales bacterium]